MNATRSPFDNEGRAAIPRPHPIETGYDAHAGWIECSLVGDIYYRGISTWMASRQTVGKVIDIYMAGVRYEAALDQFLTLSLGSPITIESRLNCEGARLYKNLLVKEIDYLAGKLSTVSESNPTHRGGEPWPPIVQKPTLWPAQIDSDVTVTFRERIAA